MSLCVEYYTKELPFSSSLIAPYLTEWILLYLQAVVPMLVINIPGQNVSSGTVLSDYIGSSPPKGTGLHRYVFLVYKQPGNIRNIQHGHLTTSGKNRANFKIVKFAKKHHLGNPVAGNFFQAKYKN
ncbi:phosphatidylethanolamine-binding protein [Onchocerca flexuosa]|uniref:Phosphatidylethanolamine-binding protein n=1 Tax=Onchocerca flexuosa TaxID=387005 RepID=A0A238BLW7_9BILA|nr:phosphatidylethanolamine-binding protein [Onchocerca flexuosa]